MWEQEGPREISGQGHVSWLRKINPEVGGGHLQGVGIILSSKNQVFLRNSA